MRWRDHFDMATGIAPLTGFGVDALQVVIWGGDGTVCDDDDDGGFLVEWVRVRGV